MKRFIKVLATLVALVSLIGLDGAGASSAPTTAQTVADAAAAPRSGPPAEVLVNTPWGKDDTVGEATRPQGDLRRIVVENGRTQMHFTFRTVETPLWDTPSTDRIVGMVFDMDWQGTTVPPNRTLIVTREDGVWNAAILNGGGNFVCGRTGGVRQLSNHRFKISAPVAECLGGAHVLRVLGTFVDDADDGAPQATTSDAAPNSRFYGPFIRLPQRSRSGEAGGTGGWTVY